MSLDMGVAGLSSVDAHVEDPAAMQEDYCLHAVQRFRHQWTQTRSFQPAALRHYGVRGDTTLTRSLMQRDSFGASFGTFTLGDLRDFEPAAVTAGAGVSSMASQAQDTMRGINGDYDVPMGAVVLGPAANPLLRRRYPPEQLLAARDELSRSWIALTQPSGWNQAMCGVLTVANWVTVEQRQRAKHQLRLAAFMGVKAVQVPLPMLLAGRWETEPGDPAWSTAVGAATDWPSATAQAASTIEAYDTHNWQLLGAVADILAAYIAGREGCPQVWIRCDACYPLQRRQFQALRSLVLYGCERDPATGLVVGPKLVTTNNACDATRREAIQSLTPLLYFSNPHELSSFSTEWLGEDVSVFEVPPADLMLRALQPNGAVLGSSPMNAGGGGNAPAGVGRDGHLQEEEEQTDDMGVTSRTDCEYGAEGSTDGGAAFMLSPKSVSGLLGTNGGGGGRCGQEEEGDVDGEADVYSLPGLEGTPVDAAASPTAGASKLVTPAESPRTQQQRAGASGRPLVWQLPDDLLPVTASCWGGHYPPRVSLLTLLVELMRRRATPIFSHFFFDHYAVMNYLYASAVVDSTRERFIGFEDVLQLPLQPLGHQLSSGVYEVFERDASKYRQYREAFYAYTLDWVNAPAAVAHHGVRCASFARHRTPAVAPCDGSSGEGGATNSMYVVLLGCGRGPLIDEILSAASSLSVRVRLFAIEKNEPAAAFTEMRWRCDPEWQHLAAAFGHTLCTIVADGRSVFDRRAELSLPPDFGLCDAVVSELLGSFGDNELSPECIEGFLAQLRLLQAERHAEGLSPNPAMVSLPESYTAWVAPVHAVRLEQAVAEAAMKGLTVRPEGCPDRHAALFHSPFVCNLTRAVMLAPPQPCWTFYHSSTNDGSAAPAASSQATATGVRPAKKANRPDAAQQSTTNATTGSSYAFERKASLQFAVAPQGRCSGFAGYFSAVLYTPRNAEAAARSPVTVHEGRASGAITLSTAPVFSSRALVDGRTPGMYSWFPCFFPVDPARVRDIPIADDFVANAVVGRGAAMDTPTKTAQAVVTLEMSRHCDPVGKRVWYSWTAGYGDASRAARLAPLLSPRDAATPEERRSIVCNEGGWASSILL